uniref:hypothetical protein n=1 Tax=Cronobacter malonaticus TaxID=413503 RepID=UPI001E5A10A1
LQCRWLFGGDRDIMIAVEMTGTNAPYPGHGVLLSNANTHMAIDAIDANSNSDLHLPIIVNWKMNASPPANISQALV